MNERITELRAALKLDMQQFGQQLGYSKSYVSMVENGHRAVSDTLLKRITQKFPVNEAWLRSGEGEMLNNVSVFSQQSKNDMTAAYARSAIEQMKPYTDLLIYHRKDRNEAAPEFDAYNHFALEILSEEPLVLLHRLLEVYVKAKEMAEVLNGMLFPVKTREITSHSELMAAKEEVCELILKYQENEKILKEYLDVHDTIEKIVNIEERIKTLCQDLHWKDQIIILQELTTFSKERNL